VKAPVTPTQAEIRVQNVLSRSQIKPMPRTQAEPVPGVVLLTVDVSGPRVQRDGQDAEMPFLAQAPVQPDFLKDIIDDDIRQSNYATKQFVFNSKSPQSPVQHTMNDIQFGSQYSHAEVLLGSVEEWTIKNTTSTNSVQFNIDHPFHIHINPFQVSEFFDPNENLVNATTGALDAVVGKDAATGKDQTQPVPRYVTDPAQLTDPNNPFAKRQCYLDPKNPATWSMAGARSVVEVNGTLSVTGPCAPQATADSNKSIWHDVFAMPSGRVPVDASGNQIPDGQGNPIIIPGYFKMRSRFVDYPGLYVMHCHILIHEDRGMMFSVEVIKAKSVRAVHH
jgi:FtsP/CotA-like multicopper oxidase with cupredoxin domain